MGKVNIVINVPALCKVSSCSRKNSIFPALGRASSPTQVEEEVERIVYEEKEIGI